MGDADRPPPPPLNLVADLGGGALYLTVGLLAAAIEARNSGRGQIIDVAMVDGVTHLMSAFQAFRQQGAWTEKRADNIVDGGAPFYGCYATKDGKYVAVGAIEPHFYATLLACMGLEAAALPDQNDRAAWPEMRERFAAVFRTRTRDEWVAAAAGRDACLAPALTIDEAPEHPHMRARAAYAHSMDAAPEPGAALRAHAGLAAATDARAGKAQPRGAARMGPVRERRFGARGVQSDGAGMTARRCGSSSSATGALMKTTPSLPTTRR